MDRMQYTSAALGDNAELVSRARKPAEVNIMGVRVCLATMSDYHQMIREAIETRRKVVITSQNLHGIYVYHRTPEVRALHAQAIPRVDGMSLVFIARVLGISMSREHRLTWVDWIHPFMEEVERRSWRLYYLGSEPGVAEQGIKRLRVAYPKLDIFGHHGHFDSTLGGRENEQVLEDIANVRPDILLVGMGMPRQEIWVYQNLSRLNVSAILTCGAAMDYLVGRIPTPPRWMGRVGLEWLYRLMSEPRRLGHRYLVEPWSLAGRFARDLWKYRFKNWGLRQ